MLTADTTVTWSLLGESNSDYGLTKAACSPLPLSRHELAGLDSNQRRRTVQSRGAPADRATGQWSPRQVLPPASRTYKVRPVTGPGGACARRDSNPQPPGPRPGASACWATSTWSLRADLNGLPAPYERAALPGELRRHGSRSWPRTTNLQDQNLALCQLS